MSDDAVYADDGSYLGEMVMVDDQTAVLINDGQIIGASTIDPSSPDGWAELDPAEFTIENDGEDPRLAELQARADALEQQMNEPRPPMQMPELPEAREQQWATGVMRELSNLEQMIGRSLTHAEMHRILGDSKADFDAGVGMNVFKSAEAAGLNSFSPGRGAEGESSAARHENRSAYMAELLEDQAREERGETFGDAPARRSEEYDTSNHDGRVTKAMDHIDGHDTNEPAFDYEGME